MGQTDKKQTLEPPRLVSIDGQSAPTPNSPDLSVEQRMTVIDRHVGARIRIRRTTLGLSQQQLGALIGVTTQQANKYERGMNRVTAGRLFEFGRALGVPTSFFFEGVDAPANPTRRNRLALELARNFSMINDAGHQEAVAHLARSLAMPSGLS